MHTERMRFCAAHRTGWYEFTRTASNFNITSASSQLSNVTNAVDQAVSAFQSTKSSLVAGGNPSLKVLHHPYLIFCPHEMCIVDSSEAKELQDLWMH